MKIGIVTVQDSNNFGSFLQAYALQHVLQDMGHEVFFIRSRSKEYIKRIFYQVRPNKHDILHLINFIKTNWNGWKKYQRFQEEQLCFQLIDQYTDMPLDLVILGSDEIWNVQTLVFRDSIFYGNEMNPVMAYAVSIGNASIEEMNCIPTEYFHHISPILARDLHTSEFLNTLQIDAPIVCDPTLLVDKSVFYRNYQNKLFEGKPYILVYSYGLDNTIVTEIKKFAKENNLRILSACFPFDWCDDVFECSALDFCTVLEKAKYVFTSTFHGTIFSILNHKQFISLPQSRKTNDLLQSLQMSDRLVNKDNCTLAIIQDKLINQKIEYTKIDKNIEKIRFDSMEQLKKGLSKYE